MMVMARQNAVMRCRSASHHPASTSQMMLPISPNGPVPRSSVPKYSARDTALRPNGSSGGHHGLESIEQHLGSRAFARLKIGIGRKDNLREITGHVLGRFDSAESDLLKKVLDRAAGQVETWLDAGVEKAMQWNGNVEELKA